MILAKRACGVEACLPTPPPLPRTPVADRLQVAGITDLCRKQAGVQCC